MATRLPLVLVNGQIQQLQSSDSISVTTVTGGDVVTLTNNNAGSIPICTPVYCVANDAVDKAKADASGTKDLIGLVRDASIAASASGSVQLNGVLAATTGQWDAVFGTTGGLTKGVRYFLSAATSGQASATAPSSVGQYVQEIGIALSTTELIIDIKSPILL
jgi:hypothetical protein